MTGERITMLATKVICFSSMFRLTSMNVNKLHFSLYHKYFLIEFLDTIGWQLNWMANWICFDIAPSVSACACLPSNPAFRFLSLLRKKKIKVVTAKDWLHFKSPLNALRWDSAHFPSSLITTARSNPILGGFGVHRDVYQFFLPKIAAFKITNKLLKDRT